MFKNERIFKILCEAAEQSEFEQHRHAACICYNNRILAIGTNRRKSHPLQKKFADRESKIWLHAEMDVIVKTINQYGVEILKDSTLFVLRLTKAGKVGNSKPCAGCQSAIDSFEIGNLFYT